MGYEGGVPYGQAAVYYSWESVIMETHRACPEPALSVVYSLHPPNIPPRQGGD